MMKYEKEVRHNCFSRQKESAFHGKKPQKKYQCINPPHRSPALRK
jgi:hypothetical protein